MNIIRHGEIVLKEVNALPEGAILKEESKDFIVGHSETGHHHRITVKEKPDMNKVKFYTAKDGEYVEVPAIAELWHEKSGEYVHKTIPLSPGIYKRQRKQEYDYFAGIMREVRD